MARETLLNFFDDLGSKRGRYLVYDDGFRASAWTYSELVAAARAFAARLEREGVGKGDHVVIWSENRPEWIAALWGCLLRGAVLVPADYRASREFLDRIRETVAAKLVLSGDEVSYDGGLALRDIDWKDKGPFERAVSELAEIIFTSGATSEPKGVTITHRNVLANIVPVEREIAKYRKWGRPFRPIRFLNLLPLSHLFGQAMAAFIPPMLAGEVVFMRGHNPKEIVRQIHTRRISVLVSVPKILEVLREYVIRVVPEAGEAAPKGESWPRRWWRYRRVHRLLGWKFWSFIAGAAPLDPALEAFWSGLGYVVIQGYGLTETAPIVTLNHPFHARQGSVGKPIAGVEVKIADDGEVLVRGENVTSGYFNAREATEQAFHDGWFHTGDIGSVDVEGRLHIQGRKKEMIVTPEGLNVFPEDVERVLNGIAGVRESAAVGKDRAHAVLVLEPGAEPSQIVRDANRRLEDHQQIRGYSLWPTAELPRTEGTRKLKRGEIATWVESGRTPAPAHAANGLPALLARYAPDTSLAELGLSSLERIELMTALEVDERAFHRARTVGELSKLAETPVAPAETIVFPEWNQSWWARVLRRISLPAWILPLARVFAWVRAEGRENLRSLEGPVIFAVNHQSHFDLPSVLMAMPARWRYRTATAMSKEFFHKHFYPAEHTRFEWFTNSLNYWLSCLFFNTFPLPQREAGASESLAYMGRLAERGLSILIFPEGKRTEAGEISAFQPGIGMIASRLKLPIVPVRIVGLERVLHRTAKFPTPGRVRVKFGKPRRVEGGDYAGIARAAEEGVRSLS